LPYFRICGFILYLYFIEISQLNTFLMMTKRITFLFLLGCLKVSSQVPAYVPTSSLTGFWTFSGNANDVSGNGNNGTVNGAALTSDRFSNTNSAYSFNGSSDYISTNYAGILGTNARAVSFWAKTSESVAVMSAVGWGGNSQATRYDCAFNYGANGATIDGAYGAITYSSSVSISNNQWHHYVYQFSNSALSQVQVYQDGVLLTQIASSYNPTNILNTTSSFNVNFGQIVYSSPIYFNGSIDDIGIWSRALTNCEIQQLYTASLGTLSAMSSPPSICAGNSATLTVTGGVTYTWTPGGANTTSVIVTPSVTTTYSVISGCSADTLSVFVNPLPTLTITSSSNPLCFGSSATLIASGASNYNWPGIGSGSSIVVNPLNQTTYTVIGSNAGCSSSLTLIQNIAPIPALNLSSSDTVICTGASVNIIASGASTYTWQPGSLNGATITVSPLSATVYTVTGATAMGCSVSATWSIAVNPSITINAVANPVSVCSGNSSTLSASGAISYTWLPGNSNGSSIVVNPVSATLYTVIGASGSCSASTTVNVNVGQVISISSSGNLCNNNTVDLYASPVSASSSVIWSGPGIIGSSTTPTITLNSGGVYSVVVTNTVTNCSGAATFNVISSASPLALNIVPSSTVTCFPGPSVNMLVSASANLNWFPSSEVTPNNGPLVSVSPSVTSTYTVIGTLGSCTGSAAITISVNITPTVISTSGNPTICAGASTTLSASGAAGYSWLPGNLSGSTVTISPGSSTIYTLTGLNGNCTSTANAPVIVLTSPNITAAALPSVICIGQTATLIAAGSPTLSWLLSNPPPLSYTAMVNPTVTANYTVTGTNALGCSSSATVELTVINSPAITALSSNTSICAGQSITLTASGATTYTWMPGFQVGAVIINTPTASLTYTALSGNSLCSYATVVILVNLCFDHSFGLTNAADDPVQYNSEFYHMNFTVTASNASNNDLTQVALNDDLAGTFLYPITYTIVSPPTVISKNSSLIANPLFNGNSDLSLTTPLTSTLHAITRDTITFAVMIDPNGFNGILKNSVVGFAKDKNNITVSDSSNDGFDPDPDHDGDPTNNNVITLIDIEPIDLFIPEGFSPNDDGKNDLFLIKGMNGKSATLTIYNRWGNKVYSREGTDLSWDGKANVNGLVLGHNKLPPATYYYVFEFSEGDHKTFTGFIVLAY
jgi:gliding motility-associated-like protein